MKVSKQIRIKMGCAARHFKNGQKIMAEVDEYFSQHGYVPETLRTGDGVSLEEIEYGNDVTDDFCDKLENGGYDI